MTQELLKEYFRYDNGKLFWIKKPNYKTNIGAVAGYLQPTSKRFDIAFRGKKYRASRLIWLFHHGTLPDYIDHINRDGLDDRIENLRPCTHQQNMQNRNRHKNSKSIYKGVSFNKSKNQWVAKIRFEGKQIVCGKFYDEKEAAFCYDEHAIKYYKEFASTNILYNPYV